MSKDLSVRLTTQQPNSVNVCRRVVFAARVRLVRAGVEVIGIDQRGYKMRRERFQFINEVLRHYVC